MEWKLKPEDTRLLLKSLFALAIIGIVAAVLVIPSRARLAELDTAIAGVQEKIARQEAFAPMFAELRRAAEREAGLSFGFPAHAPLDRQKLQDLPGLVQDKAQAAGLSVLEMTLDVNSVLLDRSRVMLQGVFFRSARAVPAVLPGVAKSAEPQPGGACGGSGSARGAGIFRSDAFRPDVSKGAGACCRKGRPYWWGSCS